MTLSCGQEIQPHYSTVLRIVESIPIHIHPQMSSQLVQSFASVVNESS